MSTPQPILLESEAVLLPTVDGHVIKRQQVITQSFLDDLKADRDESLHRRERNFMKVASLPNALVEHWQRQGFDILDQNVKGRDIVARLKREGLDYFLATEKSV